MLGLVVFCLAIIIVHSILHTMWPKCYGCGSAIPKKELEGILASGWVNGCSGSAAKHIHYRCSRCQKINKL